MNRSIKRGFTLIEILVVVCILALLTLALILSFGNQRDKADDARTKADLARLKIAFEEYYNDNNCYPPVEWFDDASDCNSNLLAPYLQSIPCDRSTGLPYVLETDSTTCGWFKFYATLNLPSRDAEAISQRTSSGGSTLGNFGVSSTNTAVSIHYDPTSSSPPGANPSAGPSDLVYYCSNVGNCTNLPAGLTCNSTWLNDANCGGTNQSKCSVASICN